MDTKETVRKQTYIGLFMVTLATLMYEILLTRIFSVSMWYHFAFLAISVAMFGMTVGALLVYLFPNYFIQERAKYHLALSSFWFAVSIIISFLTHLSIPFSPPSVSIAPVLGLYSIALTYLVIAIPFVFSGICVCLALTKFPRQISKLYAADLAGAAIGCVLLIYTLKITDGPTAVFLVALLAIIGALFFLADECHNRLMKISIIFSLIILSFIVGNTILVNKQSPLVRLLWIKNKFVDPPLYEKWNSFSNIRVTGKMNEPTLIKGWGFSPKAPFKRKIRQVFLTIDASAGTVLTAYDGNLNDLEHLKYDVTNLVHYLRPNSNILVFGTGGGRDVLSALVFKQKSVVGVEINEDIIDTANKIFGDFTGHLDRYPNVTFINDEARSYTTRQKDKFDIIQVSLIDTWAATTAGAFVLTENSLYTTEAWKIFLEKLTPRGILTFSRWYLRDNPGEVYKLTSLATASLMQSGITNPRDHIVLVRRMNLHAVDAPNGIGTMLVSKTPFTKKDLDIINDINSKLQYDLVLSPDYSLDSNFATIASGKNLEEFTSNYPQDIAAPTDDKPFFFHMLRFGDIFHYLLSKDEGYMKFNMKAVIILLVLLLTVIGLTFLCIIVPLILTTEKSELKGALPLFLFFASIGFGFMLVEISQMQRLIVFLGHPTYSLSVVLFALLLSSGLGSFLTQNLGNNNLRNSGMILLLVLLVILIGFGMLTPYVTNMYQGSVTAIRILVATGILFPIGLFMGMAFPLGMKIASNHSDYVTPWLWGINGATSVCASVIAVVIALNSGISASFWTGFSCYIIAFLTFIWASHRNVQLLP